VGEKSKNLKGNKTAYTHNVRKPRTYPLPKLLLFQNCIHRLRGWDQGIRNRPLLSVKSETGVQGYNPSTRLHREGMKAKGEMLTEEQLQNNCPSRNEAWD